MPIRRLDFENSNFHYLLDLSSDEASANEQQPLESDELLESQGKETISSMVNWIERVGKPAVETQESLYSQLYEKDNDCRRALIELESLKDENIELQESLKNRPTNQEHKCDKRRATQLEVNIHRLGQKLNQKDRDLRSATKQAEKMMQNGQQLESNKKELAAALSKVTQDFTSKLTQVNKRNKTLESSVGEKDKDMRRLMDAVRDAEKKRKEGLLRKVVSRMNHSLSSTAKRSRRSERRSRCRSSTRRVSAEAAAQAVTPKNLSLSLSNSSTICSTPSHIESYSSIPSRKEYTLSCFLETITSLSRRIEAADHNTGSTENIDKSLGAFQEEIQRCIENWNQGEVPLKEITGLMERVFEEWVKEKSARIHLEHEINSVRQQQHGIVRQICGNLMDIPQEETNKPSAILWLPVRIAGWFVWVPIKLGSLSISTYAYLMKKVIEAAGDVLGRGRRSKRADDTMEFPPV